jgi:hypothetical protein
MQLSIWSLQFAAANVEGAMIVDLLDMGGRSVGYPFSASLTTDNASLQTLSGDPAAFRALNAHGAIIDARVAFRMRAGASYTNVEQLPAMVTGDEAVWPPGRYLLGSAAGNGVIEAVPLVGDPFGVLSLKDSKVVSNTILRAFGAANWTGATGNGGIDREQYFWQNGSQDAYLGLVAVGASLTGAVSSTLARAKVPAGGVPVKVFVPEGYDTAIVKATSSAETVYGEEWVRS